jgi:hypothetical protein
MRDSPIHSWQSFLFPSTCRRHRIDPQIYITQLLANLPATPMSQLDTWLPDQWKPPTPDV